MSKSNQIIVFVILLLIVGAFVLMYDSTPQEVAQSNPLSDGNLQVHFIDVGQGDATLLVSQDTTILIDTGRHDGNEVVPYLTQAGVQKIDLLVGTHPHSDHIGQIDKVLGKFPVSEVWMSGDIHTSSNFERVLDAILEAGTNYHEPRAGETFKFGDLHITVVHPTELTGDFNNGSIGMHIQYGDVAFLFTGDAEAVSENRMLSDKRRLQAQIFHVAHHGSSTSNTEAFLQAVDPELAVYSAGIDNTYGHPHRETVSAFANMGIPFLGTDKHGTIIVETDGKSYQVLGNLQDEHVDGDSKDSDNTDNVDNTGKINLNTASREELQQIMHIGAERVDELLQYRPYTSVDELKKINGIGNGRLNDIKKEGKAYVD